MFSGVFFPFFYFIIFTFTYMCIHWATYHFLPPFTIPLACNWEEPVQPNSWTERLLVFLPCTCILQTTLFHLCQTSSLLPAPLSIVASASLRLLYSLLYTEYINHIQLLGFLPFPYSLCAHSPLSVWPMSNNNTAFFLCLQSAHEGEHDFWPSEPG
jgi:hypothetical protein